MRPIGTLYSFNPFLIRNTFQPGLLTDDAQHIFIILCIVRPNSWSFYLFCFFWLRSGPITRNNSSPQWRVFLCKSGHLFLFKSFFTGVSVRINVFLLRPDCLVELLGAAFGKGRMSSSTSSSLAPSVRQVKSGKSKIWKEYAILIISLTDENQTEKFSYLALSQSNFVCIIINWHIFARTVWLSIVDLHSI